MPKDSEVELPQGYFQIDPLNDPSKKTKQITKCEHTSRKHYAKGMCSTCYHKLGRTKKAWKCRHLDRLHYAKGCCHECYVNFHSKRGKARMAKRLALAAKQQAECEF